MDKGRIAEWFLSLVMDRGQAVGVVGDLLETRAARNGTRFWSSVFRISAGNVWHDVRSQPRFVFGLALQGLAVEWGVAALLAVAAVVALNALHVSAAAGFPVERLQVAVFALGPTFCAGRWIAKYSHGKEVAVCVAMTLSGPPFFHGLGRFFWWFATVIEQRSGAAPTFSLSRDYGYFLLCFLPTLLGAALVRRRRLAVNG